MEMNREEALNIACANAREAMEAMGQRDYEDYTEEEILDVFADNAITSVSSEWKDDVSGAYWEEIDRIKTATRR